MLVAGLSFIFLIVLVGPFVNRKVEGNLELFLFIMGALSATISSVWTAELFYEALTAPIYITLAVLGAGLLFHYLRHRIDLIMAVVLRRFPLAAVISIGVVVLRDSIEYHFGNYRRIGSGRIYHRSAAAPAG